MTGLDVLARSLMAFAVAVLLAWAAVVSSPTVWVQPDYSRPVAVTGAGDAPPPHRQVALPARLPTSGRHRGSLSPVPVRVPGPLVPHLPGPGTHPPDR